MRRAADTSLDVSTFQGIIGLISRVHCAHASNELRELFTIISPLFRLLVSSFAHSTRPLEIEKNYLHFQNEYTLNVRIFKRSKD